MKTTQEKALKALKAMNEICKYRFHLSDSLKLKRIWKELGFVYEFQVQEEQKLVDEYQPENVNGLYTFRFDKDDVDRKEQAAEFQKKLAEIGLLEIELNIEPVRIYVLDKFNDFCPTPETLMDLDGFVEFIEPEPEVPAE